MTTENQPIRILQATVSNDKGGLTGYICQNYRYMDKQQVQFDFLTYETELDFRAEFEKMGARFFVVPKPSHFLAYYQALKQIHSQNQYKAIHFNISYANFIPLLAARLAGFSRIICHSHSTEIDDKRPLVRGIKKCIHYIGRALMPVLADEYLTCSDLAGQWMYPESLRKGPHYHIAKNAIDLEKYCFNPEICNKIRKTLGIGEHIFCIGHVGRFSYQKNHEFLIQVFAELHQQLKDSCLLLIGGHMNGDAYYENARDLVQNLHLENSVQFLGIRKDVPNLMQAMDCFVLPSHFEGLPIVGIEAQAAGLPCIVSDQVSREMDVCDNVQFISIDSGASDWVESLLQISKRGRCSTDGLIENGYEIHSAVRQMELFYDSLARG